MIGSVKFFDTDRGYGFIVPESDDDREGLVRDYFFHQKDLRGIDRIAEGRRVEFDPGENPKGPRAFRVRPA